MSRVTERESLVAVSMRVYRKNDGRSDLVKQNLKLYCEILPCHVPVISSCQLVSNNFQRLPNNFSKNGEEEEEEEDSPTMTNNFPLYGTLSLVYERSIVTSSKLSRSRRHNDYTVEPLASLYLDG
jgi:hypothetical protein